jgi:oxygen-dependent protoporphyrinogen oxidase
MAAMERDYGSLFQALLAKKKEDKQASAMGPKGVLTSFAGGIGHLAKTATQKLGARARGGTKVTRLSKSGAGYHIETSTGLTVDAASVVVAVPAFSAAELTGEMDPALSGALSSIAYADCVVICTGYRKEQVGRDVNGFGFLVPRNQNKRVLGCLWTSSIFPHQAPEGWVLLRTIYGGYNDADAVRLTDQQLLEHVQREVEPLVGISTKPEFVRIFRHLKGIPQYLLSHGKYLSEIEAAEERHAGLVIAGNAYRGVGLNDCVVSAHRAVSRLTA